MKMKLREQRQNYVSRYRKLMEKIELDGKEILMRYLEIGKVMQAKANKEMHEKIKKMLEDKLKRKTLLVENVDNLRLDIQASESVLKQIQSSLVDFLSGKRKPDCWGGWGHCGGEPQVIIMVMVSVVVSVMVKVGNQNQ